MPKPTAPELTETNPLQTNPLVSVVVPAYNAEAFISKTLASICAQTYPTLEIWVVDDGSSDRTSDIVEALAQQDARIQLLRQPNQGVAAARNAGIRSAKGEFVAPIDADDLWSPDALHKLVAKFQTTSSRVGVIYTWSLDIDEYDRPIGTFHAAVVEGSVQKTLICHNFLGNASSTLIRKVCLERIGGYSSELKSCDAQGCEDWDLYLRLAEQYEFEVVPEFLVGYRKIAGGMSQDFGQMARSQQMMLETIQKKHPEIPVYLYSLSRSSFYLYLAQLCDQNGYSHRTLLWLLRAFKSDLMVLLRPGFYFLTVKSWARRLGWIDRNVPKGANFAADSKRDRTSISFSQIASSSVAPTEVRHPKVFLKIFVGSILHRSLLRI